MVAIALDWHGDAALCAQLAPMQHAADDATLTAHVDEHRSDNWASYGARLSCHDPCISWPPLGGHGT